MPTKKERGMMSRNFDFNELKKTYLIAEIGINHNGNVSFVKKMIDYASVFGWDCVKLQKRNPDKSVPQQQKEVIRDTPWGKLTYLEYRKKLEFNKEEYDEISKYAEKKVDFSASAWDLDSVDFLSNYNIPFIKVPSAHLTDDELIHYICKKGFPILVSTGMSTIKEVDHAVEIIRGYTDNFALLHTVSTYPASEEELNLKVISEFQKRYGCVVGYSGHEFGLVTTVIAVSLGAKIVERHVTLKRTMWGSDQMASVEPQGMLKLIAQIRAVEVSFGDGVKRICDSELTAMHRLKNI